MKNFFSQRKKRAILAAVTAGLCFGSLKADAAPEFFDWRLNNPTDSTSGKNSLSIVSPVESQQYGTCWTFGTFGSYESSWMQQLLAAKAAGYNVDVSRNIFSKYYLAWTANLPAVDNINDNSVRFALLPGANIYDDEHTVYDQGGDVSKSTSILIKYGVVDENAISQATNDELKNSAAESMRNSSFVWNSMNNYARMYLAYQEYKDSGLSSAEFMRMVTKRAKTLTDEEVAQVAQDAFNVSTQNAVLNTVTPKGNLHDTYTVKEVDVETPGLSE